MGEVPWCASKKENLALALLELSVGVLAVLQRVFQECTPMCASTTTGLKPQWEESSGPVMIIQKQFPVSPLLISIIFILYFMYVFHFTHLFVICFLLFIISVL